MLQNIYEYKFYVIWKVGGKVGEPRPFLFSSLHWSLNYLYKISLTFHLIWEVSGSRPFLVSKFISTLELSEKYEMKLQRTPCVVAHNFFVYKPILLIFNTKQTLYKINICAKFRPPTLSRSSPNLLSTDGQTDGHS